MTINILSWIKMKKMHPEARNIMFSISIARRERKLALDDILCAVKNLESARDHLLKAGKALEEEDFGQSVQMKEAPG